MQRVTIDPASASHRPHAPTQIRADKLRVNAPLERRILGYALVLGVVGDLLLRDPPVGLAFPVWITLFVVSMIAAAWHDDREISAEVSFWLASAILFSFGLAWRDSEVLQFFDVVATLGSLMMAAIALSNGSAALLAARFRDTVWAAALLVRTAVAGFLPIAVRELLATKTSGLMASRIWPVARAAVIAGSLLLVFGSLLRGADPIFASLVTLPQLDFETIMSHIVVTGFFAWLVSGWARGALVSDVGRVRAPATIPFGLSLLDITTALVTLNVLFGTFVVAQLGWFFGGEEFLRARTGLTASAYARQGFFEMLWVVLLVVPLLVATRAMLQPGRALERRHTALSIPVIALLGAIILSAALRMKLYVHYFGLTTERFYPLVVMGWLGVVLIWLALTVLRGNGRPFIAGVALSGLAVLAALNVIAPDAIVARYNIARSVNASRDAETVLDLRSLSRLSGEAADLAVRATLASPAAFQGKATAMEIDEQRCDAARSLLRRWGPASTPRRRANADGAWRFWNAGESDAVRVVGANSADLRRVSHEVCVA